uniref:Calcium channel, voltage-dependent, alpha 2/delta subunit 1a n=1 Tax=Mastacembelus armatus TaxID=205130 RepID=A0A7N9AVW1_9TELE
MENLIQIYEAHRAHFSVESNNARELVATAAGNIERLLNNRSQALRRLATEAERFQMEHEWSDDSEVSDQSGAQSDMFINTEKKNRYVPDDFHVDPDFKRLVSYNTTAVHIPTDIYEGSTIILNELNWTAALEEVFRKNKEEDPSLLWQVFGSATGLARYYPASPWIDLSSSASKIDLYDVRRRPWYIQGAASPKDMLILVDASGSVSGLTLKLIRTSVSKMLETLSDDDFVNVVSFNEEASFAACFQNLVQANVRNKRILKDAVQNITAKGITNYKGGFKLAFEQLAQTNVSRANCNKIIMLFTDGGEERAEEIFQKYNPKQTVRIFTFSVGQHNYDKGPIQWMACANKGYYYEIPSIGAIRINTQEYLDVLGRPMIKADKKSRQVQWTNVYLDALELGLVITGTVPVFNKTKTGSKNQLILGVVAIDVSLEDIKRLTPRFTFGPNGYYFAIDPNGYVLLHPNLQPLLRKKMIDGLTGDYTISTLVKSQDERYIDQGQRTYTFAPVKGTDYSLALVLPEYSMHYIRATIGDTITQAKCKQISILRSISFCFHFLQSCFASHRMYCKDLKPPDKKKNNTEFLMEFNNYIDIKTPNNPMCEYQKREEIVWCVYSGESFDNSSVLCAFYQNVFNSAGMYWKEEAETYESSFYKRSLDNDLYIVTPTPYLAKENGNSQCLIGSFFGVIDPVLMRSLKDTLFTFKKTYDYQSLCDPKKESKAAAGPRSVYVPTIADILNIGWWVTAAVCITEQTQFYFMNNNVSFKGTVDCENCSRLYHAEKLPNTNLVFIIADAKLTCSSCDAKELKQEEEPCILLPNIAVICVYDNNDPDCGGVSTLSPSLWLMVALQLALLWVVTGSRHHAIPS